LFQNLDNALSHLQWLPDEIVFSLASRHHRLTGNARSSDTCQQLFGHATQGSAHDLPSRIKEFVQRTGGVLGDTKSIINTHTILPFFLPFRSTADSHAAYAALEGDGLGSLKYKLGLLTSRFRAHHPLKACCECMAVDRQAWAVAYWHRSHQLPGAWVCDKHSTPLLMATIKSTGVRRFHWTLPDDSRLVQFQPSDMDPLSLKRMSALTAAAIKVTEFDPEFHFSPEQLLNTYVSGLAARGLTGNTGCLRLREIGVDYFEHVRSLRTIPEFQSLPSDAGSAQSQISRLLYLPRSGTHPIRHLLVISWLFESFENFWQHYIKVDSLQCVQEADTCFSDPVDHRRERAIEMLKEGRQSASAVAKMVGASAVTCMAWAAAAGIRTGRRPKILTATKNAALLHDLGLGMDKQDAAVKHGVSVVTITRVLRTEIGLHARWTEVRHEKARRSARAEWSQVSEMNPATSVKLLRLMAGAAYAWLYRHDKDWLQTHRPAVTNRDERKSSVDWDMRDHTLATSVRQVCLELIESHPASRVMLWQIYQRLPELKAKLSRLDSLPLTKRALEQGLGRSQESIDQRDLLR
jgi:transposase